MSHLSDRQQDAFDNPAKMACRSGNLCVLREAAYRRRELPVALRAFVRRNGRMDGGGTLLYAGALLTTSIAVSAILGVVQGFATFALGSTLAPLAFAVQSARKLGRLGFAHGDLGPAFRADGIR